MIRGLRMVHRLLRGEVLIPGCREGRVPSSNTAYWGPKLRRNVERDGQALAALAERGWRTLVLWECECRTQEAMRERLAGFLGGPPIG